MRSLAIEADVAIKALAEASFVVLGLDVRRQKDQFRLDPR